MTALPLMRFIKSAHRILTRMGIPALGYDGEYGEYDKNLKILLERMKTLRLYQNALRGKWLREKKKAVAANRALEAFRNGNTKSWKLKAEDADRAITRAVEIWRTKHKAVTFPQISSIVTITEYLVDRSNQLLTNDSAVEKRANEEVQLAKVHKATAESRLMTVARRLQWYEQRFGFFSDDMIQDSVATYGPGKAAPSFVALAKDADSFPWKRGNPGYLGDYTVAELLHEVEMRHKGLTLAHEARNKIAVDDAAEEPNDVPPGAQRCNNWHTEGVATYCCALPQGHSGAHAENLGGMTTYWEEGGRAKNF